MGQGKFDLLASHQTLGISLQSCLQSCSWKPGAFQGTALSPERRETKQGLSPWKKEQATELTGSLSWFIVLTYSELELLTGTESDPSEGGLCTFPTHFLTVFSEWAGSMATVQLSSSVETARSANAAFGPAAQLLFGLHVLGSSVAGAACPVH